MVMATLTFLLFGLCATVVLSKNPMEDAMEGQYSCFGDACKQLE